VWTEVLQSMRASGVDITHCAEWRKPPALRSSLFALRTSHLYRGTRRWRVTVQGRTLARFRSAGYLRFCSGVCYPLSGMAQATGSSLLYRAAGRLRVTVQGRTLARFRSAGRLRVSARPDACAFPLSRTLARQFRCVLPIERNGASHRLFALVPWHPSLARNSSGPDACAFPLSRTLARFRSAGRLRVSARPDACAFPLSRTLGGCSAGWYNLLNALLGGGPELAADRLEAL
jgi:hypothetical protein